MYRYSSHLHLQGGGGQLLLQPFLQKRTNSTSLWVFTSGKTPISKKILPLQSIQLPHRGLPLWKGRLSLGEFTREGLSWGAPRTKCGWASKAQDFLIVLPNLAQNLWNQTHWWERIFTQSPGANCVPGHPCCANRSICASPNHLHLGMESPLSAECHLLQEFHTVTSVASDSKGEDGWHVACCLAKLTHACPGSMAKTSTRLNTASSLRQLMC